MIPIPSSRKNLTPSNDPVEDLRRGWDAHVEFGLTHPAFYVLMYGVPRPEYRSAAAGEGTASWSACSSALPPLVDCAYLRTLPRTCFTPRAPASPST